MSPLPPNQVTPTPPGIWFHADPISYDYSMTTIIGIIAKDGITIAADGRALSLDGSVINDDVDKLFELSQRCVLGVAGGVTQDIEVKAAQYRSFLNAQFDDPSLGKYQRKSAYFIYDVMAGALASERETWATDSNLVFLIAGYDQAKRSLFRTVETPKLYVLLNDGAKKRYESSQPYFACGLGEQLSIDILKTEYVHGLPLAEANALALKALYNSYDTTVKIAGQIAKPVGGQPRLWNLFPNQPIKKFTKHEIDQISGQ